MFCCDVRQRVLLHFEATLQCTQIVHDRPNYVKDKLPFRPKKTVVYSNEYRDALKGEP